MKRKRMTAPSSGQAMEKGNRCLSSSVQPEERPPRSMELLVNKILDYLAEHDGSEELYQMLHDDLGFTNAEIDTLGFNLAHRFEDEPGLALSQTT